MIVKNIFTYIFDITNGGSFVKDMCERLRLLFLPENRGTAWNFRSFRSWNTSFAWVALRFIRYKYKMSNIKHLATPVGIFFISVIVNTEIGSVLLIYMRHKTPFQINIITPVIIFYVANGAEFLGDYCQHVSNYIFLPVLSDVCI